MSLVRVLLTAMAVIAVPETARIYLWDKVFVSRRMATFPVAVKSVFSSKNTKLSRFSFSHPNEQLICVKDHIII
jgi:hypothetical protein